MRKGSNPMPEGEKPVLSKETAAGPPVVITLPCDADGTAEMTWQGELEVDGEFTHAEATNCGDGLLVIALRYDTSKPKSEYCMRMAKVKTDVDEPLPTRNMETKEQG